MGRATPATPFLQGQVRTADWSVLSLPSPHLKKNKNKKNKKIQIRSQKNPLKTPKVQKKLKLVKQFFFFNLEKTPFPKIQNFENICSLQGKNAILLVLQY